MYQQPHRTAADPTRECPRCGCTNFAEERCTEGPHYAKRVCKRCRNTCGFVPKPRSYDPTPPPEVLERARRMRRPLARLEGSESQCAWAASLRAAMIRQALQHGDADRATVIRAVADASWFAAHARSGYHEMRWPGLDQLSGEEVVP